MKKNPTVREFDYQGDIWDKINQWAEAQSFKLKDSSSNDKLYKNFKTWTMVKIISQDNHVKIESWIPGPPLMVKILIPFLFFTAPEIMGLESGGFYASAGRKMSRNKVNPLLKMFDQKLIT